MTVPAARAEAPERHPDQLWCAPTAAHDELAQHHLIRHEVFVLEQEIFAGSDRDAHDGRRETIHVLGRVGEQAAGTVRLFPVEGQPGLWQGDRLAVRTGFRTHGLGMPLVRCAVALAGLRGGSHMLAHVQLPNVAFFVRLGWRAQGAPETYVGLPHQLMVIDLPARDVAAAALVTLG